MLSPHSSRGIFRQYRGRNCGTSVCDHIQHQYVAFWATNPFQHRIILWMSLFDLDKRTGIVGWMGELFNTLSLASIYAKLAISINLNVYKSLYLVAAAMQMSMNATKPPRMPKNHASPWSSSPGTGTFIPHMPVIRWHGTKIVARRVTLLKPELIVKLSRRFVALIWAK